MADRHDLSPTRRHLLLRGGAALSALILSPAVLLAQGSPQTAAPEVSPLEDLMREHGVLRRLLLIYEEANCRCQRCGTPMQALADASNLVKTFIEDYHEKLEEDDVFPAFEKAGKLADLTAVLRAQHDAGRRITAEIQAIAGSAVPLNTETGDRLNVLIHLFTRMYRPHAAREDTVLFPALPGILEPARYDRMGDQFENRERELFGDRGFETVVGRVERIEKDLGIYDLSQFTPKV